MKNSLDVELLEQKTPQGLGNCGNGEGGKEGLESMNIWSLNTWENSYTIC